jgi:hypothetical protein
MPRLTDVQNGFTSLGEELELRVDDRYAGSDLGCTGTEQHPVRDEQLLRGITVTVAYHQ